MYNYLDFEKPVADLEGQILELKKLAESGEAVDVADEIARLEKRSKDALIEIYRSLTPGRRHRSPAIPTARTASIMCAGSLPTSRHWPATVPMAKTMR